MQCEGFLSTLYGLNKLLSLASLTICVFSLVPKTQNLAKSKSASLFFAPRGGVCIIWGRLLSKSQKVEKGRIRCFTSGLPSRSFSDSYLLFVGLRKVKALA
jgi:hypothetical protein